MAKHAKHAKQASDIEESAPIEAVVTEASLDGSDSTEGLDVSAEATGQSPDFVKPGANVHKRKSRRTRIMLTIALVVLLVLAAALVYYASRLFSEANDAAQQSAMQADSSETLAALASDARDDEGRKHGDVPALTGLFGLSVDEAIDQVGRGATVTSDKEIIEESGEGDEKKTEVVGRSVTVSLEDEATDNSGNAPTLYLECDKDGAITRVGYSTSVASLNYGDMSFADIVQSGHIVENLLSDAGLPTDAGAVEVPAAEDYRTYADDGTTIVQEAYLFSGASNATDGSEHEWSCRLTYDYSAANVSGNLADTIKRVQLYINA